MHAYWTLWTMAMALVACPYAITIEFVGGVPVMPRTATAMGHSTMYEIAMMRHARDSDFGRSGTGSGAVEVEMVELRSHLQRPAVILDNDRIRRLAAVDRSDDDIVAYERTVDPFQTRGYTVDPFQTRGHTVDPVETRGTTEVGADDVDFNTASPLTPTFVVDTPTNAVEGSSFHRRAHDDPVDDDDHRVDAVEDATTYVHDNVITLERDTDLVDDNTANSSDDTKDSGIEKKDLEDSLDGCCPICLDPLDGPCVDDVHGRSSLVDNDHHHHLSTLSDSTNKPHSLRECGHAFHRHCIERWLEVDDTCPLCRTPTAIDPHRITNDWLANAYPRWSALRAHITALEQKVEEIAAAQAAQGGGMWSWMAAVTPMVMPMEWYATHLELGELREAEMRAVEQAVNVVERIVMRESANDEDEGATEDAPEDATEDVTDNVSAQRALQRSITDDLILEFDHADAVETVIDFNSYAEMAPAPWRYALRSDGDFTEPLTRTSSHNELPATDRQHRHRQQQHHQHRRMSRDDLVLLHAASTLRTTISELRELHRELQPQIQARLHAEALQHAGYTHDNDDDNHDFTAAFEGARDWFEALVLQTRLDVQAGVLHSFEGRSERFVKAVYARASFMVANARGSETRGPALTAGGAVDRG